jgi:Flavin-binding monooxygenase-like
MLPFPAPAERDVNRAGEDIARDVSACAREVIMSAKSWMKDSYYRERGPFGVRGNMWRRPWPRELCKDGSVVFEDGSRIEDVDVVMFCTGAPGNCSSVWPVRAQHAGAAHARRRSDTVQHDCAREPASPRLLSAGYRYTARFLDPSIVDTSNSHVSPLYQHLFHPQYKAGLTFIGLPMKIVPFPQFELQTKLVARVLSGAAPMPTDEEMQTWMEQHYRCADSYLWCRAPAARRL